MPRIDAFLRLAREQDCSDIHLTVGLPPLVRMDGDLVELRYRRLEAAEADQLIREILDERHVAVLEERGAVDVSYRSGEGGRYRINVCRQRNGLTAVCRVIPDRVPRLADLGLPAAVPGLINAGTGLILVIGTTGTGKSTTLAALINEINHRESRCILTIEDPIEFVHADGNSLIVQREVGTHVPSFQEGLRAALRQDPDVIMVGELRDEESIRLAIEAAETGHLVLGTLHTRGACQAITRILDFYPVEGQIQARHTLADVLRCTISQDLVPVADGRGRRVVAEILVNTPAVAQLIREGKTFQIPQAIVTGRRHGMQLMDQALLALVQAGDIDPAEAYARATDRREFARFVVSPEHVVRGARASGEAA